MHRLWSLLTLASVLRTGNAGFIFTPVVKNNVTLKMPDGILVPLWPAAPSGSSVAQQWAHFPPAALPSPPRPLPALSYPFLDGFKVHVTTTVRGGDDDSQEDEDASGEAGMAEPPAASRKPEVNSVSSSSSSSKPCCQGTSALGSSSLGDHLNSLDFYPVQRVPRPPLVVWPESTSQYKPLNVSIKETGSPNSLNYKIYFRRFLVLAIYIFG